jgi:hypothetical protein
MLLNPIRLDIEGPYRARGWRRCLAGCLRTLHRIGVSLFVRPA